MARWILAAVVGLLVTAAAPVAQDTISGDWNLTINGPEGTIMAGCTIKQDGDKVTGTLQGPEGAVDVNGTVAGKTLTLAFSVNTPQGAIDIRMSAEVDGDSMTGTMDYGMGTADFTGKKK